MTLALKLYDVSRRPMSHLLDLRVGHDDKKRSAPVAFSIAAQSFRDSTLDFVRVGSNSECFRLVTLAEVITPPNADPSRVTPAWRRRELCDTWVHRRSLSFNWRLSLFQITEKAP